MASSSNESGGKTQDNVLSLISRHCNYLCSLVSLGFDRAHSTRNTSGTIRLAILDQTRGRGYRLYGGVSLHVRTMQGLCAVVEATSSFQQNNPCTEFCSGHGHCRIHLTKVFCTKRIYVYKMYLANVCIVGWITLILF